MSGDIETSKMSIGAVSRETGIPASTLRTWERRYGFPDPKRNEVGHRIYNPDVIDRLRLTHRAVEAGYRPSNVVGMTGDELRELIDARDLDGSGGEVGPADVPGDLEVDVDREWLADWLRAAAELDGETLTRQFRNDWNRLGGLEFLCWRATPFLQKIGEEWARDNLKVAHEHYSSEVLRDFLSAQWRPRSTRSMGPEVVLASPEGEQHALGLHLVACIFALADWKVTFLGPNTPAPEIDEAVRANEPDAVAISIAASYHTGRASTYLDELEDELSRDVELLVGGRGAPQVTDDIRTFEDLESLYDWAFERAN